MSALDLITMPPESEMTTAFGLVSIGVVGTQAGRMSAAGIATISNTVMTVSGSFIRVLSCIELLIQADPIENSSSIKGQLITK